MNDPKRKSIKKDIAIIGMSGKFPRSKDLNDFWDNLKNGNELIDFYSNEELEKKGVLADLINHPGYVKVGSFIDDPGSFDHSFFGYTSAEAALMDPQIRVLHEQVWKGLEDAGYNPFKYKGKIGTFFSASDNVNWRTHVLLTGAPNVNPFFVKHISNESSISRLVAYALNLKGPSYFLDTACSSSLVTVHLACRNLLLKECSIALAGGVSISSSTDIGYMHEPGGIYSVDGHCRAFDSESSGTIAGEGVGVVVLKRLEDALNDNDRIYAVIKATAVNNDGNRKVGYTAPSVSGQFECIRTAQKVAGIKPNEIGYVEAHGTGTNLGDPIEVEALNRAFEYDTNHKCAIGSLKTNIGHLDAAAGVAGVIKTALCLNENLIPPSLHFNAPNPKINFDSGPFFVNNKLTPWNSEEVRYAGLSSFGIGGTNAHAILEEPPKVEKGDQSSPYQLIMFSAKSAKALENYQQELMRFMDQNPAVNLADLAYTLKSRKHDFRYKKYLVCDAVDTAGKMLASNQKVRSKKRMDKAGVVFLFSGQGSQYYQMGKGIYDAFVGFRKIMDLGFDYLKNQTGENYKSILGYDSNQEVDAALINNTIYTQPLLFLVEYAFASFLKELGVQPTQMIGHSLGEYVAACLSGVFTFEEGLKLVLTRAQLMSAMEEGSMLSVSLSAREVEKFLPIELSIAAINTPETCVVSGTSSAIKSFENLLESKGVHSVLLKTSHAFHSEMMDPMLNEFGEVIGGIKLSEPKLPFVSSSTGLPITDAEATSVTYWVNHLRNTVQFSKGANYLLEQGYSAFVEIGSSRTLSGLLQQATNFDKNNSFTGTVLRHVKENKEDSFYLLNALGGLWENGVEIDWAPLYLEQKRNKIAVPTYVFDKIQFPCKVDPIGKLRNQNLFNGEAPLDEVNIDYAVETGANGTSENEYNEEGSTQAERPLVSNDYVEPETDTEKELTGLWKSLFGYENIGVKDDFFELGGDSLKALTLLKRIHQSFNVLISVDDFFDRCDIRELAKEIDMAKEVKELNESPNKSSKSKQIRI